MAQEGPKTMTQITTDVQLSPVGEGPGGWSPERRRDAIVSGLTELVPIVLAAYEAQDWFHFGFDNWEAYAANVLGGLKLPREQRAITVFALRERGVSHRAIAAVVGSNERTVRRDLGEGEANAAPTPAVVTGTDGKTYPATKPKSKPEFVGVGVSDDPSRTPKVIDLPSTPAVPKPKVLPPITGTRLNAVDGPTPSGNLGGWEVVFGPDAEKRRKQSHDYWRRLAEFVETVVTSADLAKVHNELPPEWGDASPQRSQFDFAARILRKETTRLRKLNEAT
jgi:hypothetical protein